MLILTTVPLAAQNANYAVPRKVALETVTRQTFPKYFPRRSRFEQLIPEQFFPIGWSRDGKFAYYVEPVDEACGCYFAHLVIQDMRTDKVLWEYKNDQSDTMDDNGEMEDVDTIEKLWKKNSKLFAHKLSEHGIIASRSTLLGKTFNSGGRRYTAMAKIIKGKNPDGYEPRVNKYSLTLITPKLGSKVLFTSPDHSKDEYWFMLDTGVIGALKSPYENRIAVIAMEINRGYEGPPHTGDIRIVGADMTSGFSKK